MDEKHRKTLEELFKALNPENPDDLDGEWLIMPASASFPPPFMVFLILVRCLGCSPVYRPREKVWWRTYFKFHNIPMFAEQSKFGLGLGIKNESNASLLNNFLELLKNALPLANEAFQGLVKTSISSGQVTIKNESFLFRERYSFLRKQAELKFEEQIIHQDKEKSASLSDLSQIFNKRHQADREGFFLASASLDAYFSLLEHYLVLLLPFTDFDPCQEDILIYLKRNNWKMRLQGILGKCSANSNEPEVLNVKKY